MEHPWWHLTRNLSQSLWLGTGFVVLGIATMVGTLMASVPRTLIFAAGLWVVLGLGYLGSWWLRRRGAAD